MTIRTPNNSYYVSGASGGQNHTLPFGADRFEDDDLFVYVWNTSTEAWDKKTVTTHYTVSSTQVSFTSGNIPSTRVIVLRKTDVDEDFPKADFVAGASIKAQDLDNNQLQALRGIKELRDQKLSAVPSIAEDGTPSNPKMYANLDMNGYKVINQPAGYITSTDILDGTIATADVADSAITAAKLASDSVTTAKIASDAVNGSKIADNSINSEHYVDGSIDTAHIADAQVTTAKIANDAVTADKLANTAVTAGSYTATDITVDAQGRVTAASSGTIGTSEIADDAVTTAKILDANVTTAKIADDAVTTAKIADAELVELATMGGNTASALADLTQSEVQILDGATVTTAELNILDGVTATATELNQLDGNTLKTTGTDFTSSSQFPAASEIDARITARIDPLGGFEAIADEDSFPATAPPAGTVISIANANSLAVNSSGVGAGTRAGGSDAVVINGFPSGFNSTSLDDGIGLLVIATSTAHTYTFHRVVAKNEDVRQLSSDINDFKARYRIGSSNPTTDNDAGDLFFNTGTSKMLVYNATSSAWEEVQAVGDFFINTLSSSSGTGGGSATFNGSAYRFTLSNAPTYAQQLLVSINGVVQKPNSGTSQPSEGFAIDGGDIILAAAPATGSNAFFITIGSSVGIGTPSDNTISTAKIIDGAVTTAKLAADSVTSAKIADGTIVNADVNASAAIAGTKISPDFGSQNVVTTGSVGVGTTSPAFSNGSGLEIARNGTASLRIEDDSASKAVEVYVDSTGTTIDSRGSGARTNFAIAGNGKMLLDNSGRLLVGTSSDTTGDTGAKVQIVDTGTPVLALSRNDTSIVSGNTIGQIRIFSNDDSGYQECAKIAAQADGTFANNDKPTRLVFSTTASSGSSPTERMRIDSSGNVGIGLTPTAPLHVGGTIQSQTGSSVAQMYADGGSANFTSVGAYPALFHVNGSERMRIDSSGQVGIGTSSPAANLHLKSSTSGDPELRIEGSGADNGIITFLGGGHANPAVGLRYISNGDSTGSLAFYANDSSSSTLSERMRIASSGYVEIGNTQDTNSYLLVNTISNQNAVFNRTGTDGTLIIFRHAGTTEGTISVSGNTVSYNGGHLSRWSQLAGGAERTEILRGSVLSNLDEMCEWAYEAQDAVLYTEEDELPEGVSVGDVKTPAIAAGTEDNEQLNRMKVSDVEGDVNVAGVFQAWDDDDDTYTNDFYCAMTGDFVIRIAQGTTVARGDLLMSAGDGTAKPQDDDIVRSKTIAKVTSTTVSTTYADGSYCVPCVLMAC